MHRPQLESDDGFSLVELLVVISLLTLIGGVVTTSLVRSLNVSAAATTRVDALTALQQGQERMSRVIREGTLLETPTPSASTLSVRLDNADGTYRIVTYTHSGDEVRMADARYAAAATVPTTTDSRVILDDMDQGSTAVFTYHLEDGATWLPPLPVADVRRISMTLIHRSGDRAIPLTTGVFLRNAVMEPLS